MSGNLSYYWIHFDLLQLNASIYTAIDESQVKSENFQKESKVYFCFLYLCNMGLVLLNLWMATIPTTYTACVEYDFFCLEKESCSGSVGSPWKAVIYNLGLAILLSGQSLALSSLGRYLVPVSIKDIKTERGYDGDKSISNSPIISDKRLNNWIDLNPGV